MAHRCTCAVLDCATANRQPAHAHQRLTYGNNIPHGDPHTDRGSRVAATDVAATHTAPSNGHNISHGARHTVHIPHVAVVDADRVSHAATHTTSPNGHNSHGVTSTDPRPRVADTEGGHPVRRASNIRCHRRVRGDGARGGGSARPAPRVAKVNP